MYLLALVFSIGYWIIYGNWIGGCLVASLLFVLVFSIYFTWKEKDKIELIVKVPNRILEQGEVMGIKLSVRGVSFLNARKCEVRYMITSSMQGVKKRRVVKFLWGKHENAYIYLKNKLENCDFYQITFLDLRWKDYTGFYSVTKKLDLSEECLVMPKQYDLEMMEAKQQRIRMEEDGYEYDGIRDYRAGDKMSMIHWKLFASKGELYVRKGDEEELAPIDILLDTSMIHKEQINDYFSIFYSISYYLLKEGFSQIIYFGEAIYSLISLEQYEELFTRVFQEKMIHTPNLGRQVLCIDPNPEGQSVADYIYDMEL